MSPPLPMSHLEDLLEKLRDAFQEQSPLCHGLRPVPNNHHLLLYYGQEAPYGRIDLAKPTEEQLENLYNGCKPAMFGLGQKNVLDETYRKAGKLDLDAFSTLFDPSAIGLKRAVVEGLFNDHTDVAMELYKLNVYGKDDFFKPHRDTPRGGNMFGSLVVVFPTLHEGGQLVLRQDDKEWTVDAAKILSSATEPSVYFVAFFSDVEHEVLPVTSGYRVTLTYNLHWEQKPDFSIVRTTLASPFHETLKDALIAVVNDMQVLPGGGYLGFGLRHKYALCHDSSVQSASNPPLNEYLRLKGADLVLAAICDELGLKHAPKLVYRNMDDVIRMSVIADRKLEFEVDDLGGFDDIFLTGVRCLDIKSVEGVDIIGQPSMIREYVGAENWERIKGFYRDPMTRVLEVESTSSVEFQSEYLVYGNEAYVGYTYGSVSLLIYLDPVESRKLL